MKVSKSLLVSTNSSMLLYTECFCNGFGNACDNRSGVCHCDEYGVDGAHCTM